MTRPHVSVDPAVQFGHPCIAGTGAPVDVIAERVYAGEPVTAVADDYDVTRADVLVACWYVARHGTGDGLGLRTKLRAAWQPWLLANESTLAGFHGLGPDDADDPPTEGTA